MVATLARPAYYRPPIHPASSAHELAANNFAANTLFRLSLALAEPRSDDGYAEDKEAVVERAWTAGAAYLCVSVRDRVAASGGEASASGRLHGFGLCAQSLLDLAGVLSLPRSARS